MNMITENLEMVRNSVRSAEREAGRPDGSVTLMAVSKLHPYDAVLEAYAAGQRLFGENHVQEILEKFPPVRPEGMDVHLIGHLQSNKIKKIIPYVDGIDSVDSLPLLEKLNEACGEIGKVMPVLLEYNTSGETAKSGFCSDVDLFSAIEASRGFPNLTIQGLMTVGPLEGGPEKTREAFRQLRRLQEECRKRYPQMDFSVLSMGMSGDFPIAIDEGSTLVRIGTMIFGQRNYGT